MNDKILSTYKKVEYNLPKEIWTWHLYGAGLENLGKNGKPEAYPMPKFGPDQLLLRIDAVGICFSDIKVINQGNKHPRVVGRDLTTDPVTLGHEAAVTIASVGDNLKDQFKAGQRFIIQADVFFGGKSMAFGYALPGAQSQYQVVGKEVINGDEGCYLIPMQESTGYAEAALAEPWACVVASYRIERRTSLKPGGVLWVIGSPNDSGDYSLDMEITAKTVLATGVRGKLLGDLKAGFAAGKFELFETPEFGGVDVESLAKEHLGFDDIIVLGADSDIVERAATVLAKDGIMNIVAKGDMARPVKIDVGKVHYMNHSYLGTNGGSIAASYAPLRVPSELKPGGCAWFIGAGGPMGQMHVQRAVELPGGPKKIVATDVDTARLESVKQRFIPIAKRRGIELEVVNPLELSKEEFDKFLKEFAGGEGFDDIVVLAPIAALMEQAVPHMGRECLMNIFAGVPIGTIASLDMTGVYAKNIRFVGSSGSKVTDLQDTLHAAEDGTLSTNTSVAAIGGIEASWDGMKAVKEGTFPGRVVIYPQIHNLPLTSLPNLKNVLPNVYAKLTDGMFWNLEAEAELLSEKVEL